MAKKFVRGITDIKTISNQDFDTNNVNDLLSDGQHNFIHRKKGNSEEYHNLTNNIKTIQSDNTDLLTVTNYNNTTNSATIRPKHDAQKEQLLESSDNTILISHGENGTDETTNVDVNPAKVLEHDNLISNSEYITIEHEDDSDTTVISTDVLDKKIREIGCTNLYAISKDSSTGHSSYFTNVQRDVASGIISAKIEGSDPYFGTAVGIGQSYQATHGQKIPVIEGKSIAVTFTNPLFDKNYVSYFGSDDETVKGYTYKGEPQFIVPASDLDGVSYITLRYGLEDATQYLGETIETKVKIEYGSIFTDWSQSPEDVNAMIGQKEQVLESTDNTIVITHGENGTDETTTVDINPAKVLEMVAPTTTSYSHEHGLMKTFVRKVSDTEEEFSFLAQMDKGENTVGFSGNSHDLKAFQYLIDTYGASGTGTININGDAFRIENGTTIIFNGNNANYNPHVVTFKDIIPTSAINTNQ